MPTITEVWEQALQINANLVILHNDLTAQQAATNTRLDAVTGQLDQVNIRLQDLRGVVASGLVSLSTGLQGVQQRQDVTNELLFLQAQQLQTVICILEKIARNTCAIQNEAHAQTGLQKSIAHDEHAEVHMFATVHPDAALELKREEEQRAEIERCCPPRPEPPVCVDQPCPAPGLPERSRRDLTPVFTPPVEDIPGPGNRPR
jgi:hypothetical protein